MKKKIYSIITVILLMVGVLTLSFNKPIDIKADSGFDTSYDSSSSSSSSSSWDDDDDDDDYSSSSSSGSSGFNIVSFTISIVIAIIIIRQFIKITKAPKNNPQAYNMQQSNNVQQPNYGAQAIDEVKKYIPNFDYNKFITDRFNDYVTIQNAWMNFDYNTLRNKLTDELYNQYIMQLDTMKIKGEKNIMENFKHISTRIIDVKEENGNIEITTQMIASFNDYIVNSAGMVIRGDRTRTLTVCYELKFVCSKQAFVDKCPNCGAPLGNSASQTCEYCNSVIAQTSSNWVMTKKQAISQR